MKLPKCYWLLLPLSLLYPLRWWLARQHAPSFFLGLSSDFWAGVTIGCSIVLAASFIAFLVLHLQSAKARSPGDAG